MHNTRTHKVEPFAPSEPGHVRMYVCGPSVYDESHLGHARSYVAYDTMKRALREYGGYRVTHVQNFTDVEESIAPRARERGMQPLEWATRLIGHFLDDMDALHVARADHYPRVSENIREIVKIVDDLEERDIAYRVDCGPKGPDGKRNCDLYFSVERAPEFGQLIGTTIEELTVERPEHAGDRRNPLDFALWKSRDDWGMTWDSPWGRGRPGWHVECTAMATKYLGADFDIHGGGLDLVFPHHESERAIGEAWSGKRYCNCYVHNGFVTVGNEKMSKSLGNFVTIRELRSRHEPEALRMFLLSAHYRAPLNYDDAAIAHATMRLAAWRAGLARASDDAAPEFEAAFSAALADDLHVERALVALDSELARATPSRPFLRRAARALGVLWDLQEP